MIQNILQERQIIELTHYLNVTYGPMEFYKEMLMLFTNT